MVHLAHKGWLLMGCSLLLLSTPLTSCNQDDGKVTLSTQQLYIEKISGFTYPEGLVFGEEVELVTPTDFSFERGHTLTEEDLASIEEGSDYSLTGAWGSGSGDFTYFFFDRYDVGNGYLQAGYALSESLTVYFGII